MKDTEEELNRKKDIYWPQLRPIHALLVVGCVVGFQWAMDRITPQDSRTLQQAPIRWFYPVRPWFAAVECLLLALGGIWLLKTRGRTDLHKIRTIISLMLLASVGGLVFYLLTLLRH